MNIFSKVSRVLRQQCWPSLTRVLAYYHHFGVMRPFVSVKIITCMLHYATPYTKKGTLAKGPTCKAITHKESIENVCNIYSIKSSRVYHSPKQYHSQATLNVPWNCEQHTNIFSNNRTSLMRYLRFKLLHVWYLKLPHDFFCDTKSLNDTITVLF